MTRCTSKPYHMTCQEGMDRKADAVFQITDGFQVNDPTVAVLWPDRLFSAKPGVFVNFLCTQEYFPGHHRCCFMGCSQNQALESIYEWTLITSIWLSNSPRTTASHLSWFYMPGSPDQPHHEGGGGMYSRPTAHRMALLDASNLVWWMCLRERCSVCVCTWAMGKTSSFRHSYYCKYKNEATNFFIRGLSQGE